ncbi:3-deoxy-manno-octulosonate cytidylyltransferase [Haloferax chudinovii]|uniref:N-acylneuraminate cytidylyltransferase n=1 Tax=Haloferax chudinovii TaxID=1109010 RepID=A0ABD5XEB0_9EURY
MNRLVVLDVDGVLTDGRINIGQSGEIFKSFDVKDGYGISQWISSGGDIAFLTGRSSELLEQRASELGVKTVVQGVSDKESKISELADEFGISLDDVVFMTDEQGDVGAMDQAGISAAPADAVSEVRELADIVTTANGGDGAVRELLDTLRVDDTPVLGVIPARYASTRFPGKPLVKVGGKRMIQRVYEQVQKADSIDQIVVATDDNRIVEAVESFGGSARMTSSDHGSGTDRVREVAANVDAGIVVNIQGDEPLISPQVIDATVEALRSNPVGIATPITAIESESELTNENTVKVVVDCSGRALFFSRSKIPSRATVDEAWKHVGLYAFTKQQLLTYTELESSLESQEDLEQLRLLENGYDVQTVEVEYLGAEVNVPEDIQRVEKYL